MEFSPSKERDNSSSHWDSVYTCKDDDEISWYQVEPVTSLRLTRELPNVESVLDIGGGTSLFAARLVEAGVSRVTVLDISRAALERGRA